jgi:hypothetical protein
MNIDFENEMLMFCLKKYDGTTEDGREFSIVARSDGYNTWIEEIETDEDLTDEEREEIETKFNEGIN